MLGSEGTSYHYVHHVAPSKYAAVDIFGLWDHAIQTSDGETIWIQTKSRKVYPSDTIKHRTFPAKYKYFFSWIKAGEKISLLIQQL